MENIENKRQQQRFVKRCEIKFSSNNRTHRGISSNFSLNGLFIKTERPLIRDTLLDIVVYLPDGSTSLLKGKVARPAKAAKAPLRNNVRSAKTPHRIPLYISKNGMGVSVVEKDVNYLHFIRSLLAFKNAFLCKIRMEAELDKYMQKRLEGKTPGVASGEFDIFAGEMQRKLEGKMPGVASGEFEVFTGEIQRKLAGKMPGVSTGELEAFANEMIRKLEGGMGS